MYFFTAKKGETKMKKLAFAIIFSIVFLFLISTAYSQDATGENDWSFELAPLYLWGIAISGDMTIKGNEQNVEADFSDIFGNLNGYVPLLEHHLHHLLINLVILSQYNF